MGRAAGRGSVLPARSNLGASYVPGIDRLGIPDINMADSAVGVRSGGKAESRYATLLPSTLGAASSWDPESARNCSVDVIGRELRAQGYNMSIGGGVDITREPRNGRNFEYAGEDPVLAGTMTGYLMKGLLAQQVMSDIKHYAFNDQETGREILSVNINHKAARESDLLAFEIAIGIAEPSGVMCAYNRVNGDYSCENDWLLNQVLKKGFSTSKDGYFPTGAGRTARLRPRWPGSTRRCPRTSIWSGAERGGAEGASAAVADRGHGSSHSAQHVCCGGGRQSADATVGGRSFQGAGRRAAYRRREHRAAEEFGQYSAAEGSVSRLLSSGLMPMWACSRAEDRRRWIRQAAILINPHPGGANWGETVYFPSSPMKYIQKHAPNAKVEFDAGKTMRLRRRWPSVLTWRSSSSTSRCTKAMMRGPSRFLTTRMRW